MKRFLSVLALLLLSVTISQTVQAQASCSVFGSSTINNGQNRTYSANFQSGASYFWSVTGPLTIIGSNTSSSVTVRGNGSGTGRVCYARYKANSLPCAACKTVTVTNPNPTCPSTLLFLGTAPECIGLADAFEASFSGPIAYTNYNWTITSGSATIIGNGTNSVTVIASNSYTISVSARCNGQIINGSRFVRDPGCDGDIIFPEINVAPNPTSDKLTINVKGPNKTIGDGNGGSYKIEVYNRQGNVKIRKTVKNSQSVDVSKLQKGLYFLRVYSNDGKLVDTKRFMIKR